MIEYEFDGTLQVWAANTAMHLITLPEDLGGEIGRLTAGVRGGWGSVKVRVRIGMTSWRTSIFPSDGTFVLPIKREVRDHEQFGVGDTVTVYLEVV